MPAAATLSLPRIKPGDIDVEVESWTTGEVVKLQLDAAKTPVQVRTPCIPPCSMQHLGFYSKAAILCKHA